MSTHHIVIATWLLISCGAANADDKALQGNWILSSVEDTSSGETVSSLHQESSTSIKNESWTGEVVPQLAFRCSAGDATIVSSIDWGRFISSFKTEIGFKVDDGKRTWLKWGVDRSEQITISPSADDTAKLVAQILGGAKLEVQISPYSQGPVKANFDLTAFDEALQQLRASCD